jgi:hypothetical protein
MLFTTVVTFLAMVGKLREFWDANNVPMAALAMLLLALTVWMLVEGASALHRARKGPSRSAD